jgi:hypothetical protein
VGPRSVADGAVERWPSTVTCIEVEARLSAYPVERKKCHGVRNGDQFWKEAV